MLSHLFFLVILCLVAGVFAHFLVINQPAVTRRYFLYHGLGALPLLLPALWLFPNYWALVAALALVATLACYFAEKQILASRVHLVLTLLIAIEIFAVDSPAVFLVFSLLTVLTLIQSSLMLGAAMGAMCLGHWYLNQPKLSITELRKACLFLFVALGIRFLFSTCFLVASVSGHNLNWLMASTVGLFLLMRYVWGLIAPLVLSFFLWETVKLSSTQSATGLLYVMVVMVLIGEIVSLYLLSYHGVFS
ncbi:MAG: hypothetical protein HYR96_14190 [Deltaproteobacteria bacterium]|nr:hypothetical protein [Deltaproteobacteria bacterium]MBI3296414.1 hypothetical protein [Deltaproteobacteria bacterium]